MPSPTPSPWWDQGRHADRRPRLLARNTIQRTIRTWFEAQDFVEVDAAALQVSPGNEAHLHAFATHYQPLSGTPQPLFLHTSPEFACKKLLSAGETRIFDFAKVWRNRERGPLHHPEFTLLEWYRVGVPYETLMEDCVQIMRLAAQTSDATHLSFRGRQADPFQDPEYLTVIAAFDRFAGIDLAATLSGHGEADREVLAKLAVAADFRVASDDTWTDIFSRVLVTAVEPNLGIGRPTILYEYPACEAALARAKPGDLKVAERFELYACGVELANAFGELNDPVEQRRRFEIEMAEKFRVYGERYPLDEDFLSALAVMPAACGSALGFDRLVMLATGADHIEQVLWVPVAEA